MTGDLHEKGNSFQSFVGDDYMLTFMLIGSFLFLIYLTKVVFDWFILINYGKLSSLQKKYVQTRKY